MLERPPETESLVPARAAEVTFTRPARDSTVTGTRSRVSQRRSTSQVVLVVDLAVRESVTQELDGASSGGATGRGRGRWRSAREARQAAPSRTTTTTRSSTREGLSGPCRTSSSAPLGKRFTTDPAPVLPVAVVPNDRRSVVGRPAMRDGDAPRKASSVLPLVVDRTGPSVLGGVLGGRAPPATRSTVGPDRAAATWPDDGARRATWDIGVRVVASRLPGGPG